MFKLLTALLVATAAVNAVPVPDDSDGMKARPEGYAEGYLEPYEQYHCRYIAINCKNQHGTKFFDDCCHPLLATETVQANRPDKCWVQNHPAPETQYPACVGVPGAPTPVNPSTSSTPAPASAPAPAPASGDDGDDEEDCPTDEPAGPTPAAPAPQPAAPAPAPAAPADPAPAPADPAPSGNGDAGGSGGDPNAGGSPSGGGGSGGGDSGSGDEVTGGFATFFFQNGNAGNCGNFNPDTAFIAALQTDTYANGANCGRGIHITNTNNGKSVDVTVADSCPTCTNIESIDLSQAAFDAIADESDGMVPITWHFTS